MTVYSSLHLSCYSARRLSISAFAQCQHLLCSFLLRNFINHYSKYFTWLGIWTWLPYYMNFSQLYLIQCINLVNHLSEKNKCHLIHQRIILNAMPYLVARWTEKANTSIFYLIKISKYPRRLLCMCACACICMLRRELWKEGRSEENRRWFLLFFKTSSSLLMSH